MIELGSCVELIKTVPDNSVDLIFTSPPYNTGYKRYNSSLFSNSAEGREKIKYYGDVMPEAEYNGMLETLFKEMYRVLKPTGSLMYNYKSDCLDWNYKSAWEHMQRFKGNFQLYGEIIWKYAGDYESMDNRWHIDFEWIFHLAKTEYFQFFSNGHGLSSIWNINQVAGTSKAKQETGHPCPFPLALCKHIIDHMSKEGDIVMDPFAGSGQVGVYCEMANRKFIGYEIDPDFFAIARERIGKAKMQRKL